MKKILTLLLALTMAASSFTGCTTAPASSAQSESSASEVSEKAEESLASTATKEEVTLKFMADGMDEKAIAQWKLLEKPLGIKLEFITAPGDQFAQKVNTMMATGEECDIITSEDSVPWRSWAEEGLLVNLDPMIDPAAQPYVDKLTSSKLYAGYKSDGKRYVMPNVHQGCDWGLTVRKDIMEKMNVSSINTMDEYYDLLVKARDDYDLLGVAMGLDDGLIKLSGAIHIFSYFGGGGIKPDGRTFTMDDGVVADLSVAKGTKDALTFINKLYREGLMNKDYATIKSGLSTTYVESGKTFSFFTAVANTPMVNEKIQTLNPEYEFMPLPAIGKDRPEFEPMTQGYNMWRISYIPSTAKHPEEALRLFEFANSKEGREILIGGEKGVTITEEGFSDDGIWTPILDGCEKEWGNRTAISPRWWGLMSTVYGYIPVDKYDTFEEAYANEIIFETSEDQKSNNPFSNKNVIKLGSVYGGSTELSEVALPIESEVRPNLNNIKGEYWNKMITVEDPTQIDGLWDAYVAAWSAGGGTEYVKAYQEFYDANHKA